MLHLFIQEFFSSEEKNGAQGRGPNHRHADFQHTASKRFYIFNIFIVVKMPHNLS